MQGEDEENELWVTLRVLLSVLSLCVEAQQLEKVPRIGFLTNDSASDWATALRRWIK